MQNKDIQTVGSQPVILFADDDKFCLNVSVKMLERLGYTVLEARDGLEAIEVYKKNQNLDFHQSTQCVKIFPNPSKNLLHEMDKKKKH